MSASEPWRCVSGSGGCASGSVPPWTHPPHGQQASVRILLECFLVPINWYIKHGLAINNLQVSIWRMLELNAGSMSKKKTFDVQ